MEQDNIYNANIAILVTKVMIVLYVLWSII